MTNAANGSIHGDDCKMYYSATLGGEGALTEIPQVIDSSMNSERRSAESNCRGDAEVSEHVGKPRHTLSLNLLAKRGSPGTAYLALRAAYHAKTPLHYAFCTGDITHIGQHVHEMQGLIKNWNESHPDNDTVKVSAEIVRDPSATFVSEVSVISA